LSTTATPTSPVGTYPIRATGGTNDNYTFLALEGTLIITPAPLTVTADDQTKVYGSAALPTFTAKYSGFVNGDTATSLTQPLTFTTTAKPSSPVGDYPITVAGGANPNYTFKYQAGTLHLSKALLTVTAEDKSK